MVETQEMMNLKPHIQNKKIDLLPNVYPGKEPLRFCTNLPNPKKFWQSL
jgi:hypothetical protein